MKIYLFLSLLFFTIFPIRASTLPENLIKFLKKQNPIYSNSMNIILYNYIPSKQWKTCFSPKFVLLNSKKLLGLTNIKVICGKINKFIQVKISIKGKYVRAARNINKGEKLTNKDVFVEYGYLDKISSNIYSSKQQVLNLISLKAIKKNELITNVLLRPMWLIETNQKVLIIIKDSKFTIISEGRAINNAYMNQQVKVKLDNGKIILGIANNKRYIVITNK
ncbi:MAG: flagellar basal body P-ring formation chaperone FlgA [Buchnera aphidicola (Floraphis choui)]